MSKRVADRIFSGWPQTGLFLAMASVILPLFFGGCSGLVKPFSETNQVQAERILRTSDGQQVTQEQLLEEMLTAQVIYLGEKHDNPHHHRLQHTILEKLLASGKRPAIGFEFFSREQTGWLMNFTVGKPSAFSPPDLRIEKQAETLRQKLGWERRQDWAFYWPLLQLAHEYHLPVFGADLPEGTRIRLTRQGLEELSPVEKMGLSPTPFHHDDYRRLLLQRLTQSHCGMATEALLERLYTTWVARNDAMAMAITMTLANSPNNPILMILGAGHVANDMGVYERVAFLQPGVRQLNLGFQENAIPALPFSHYLQTEYSGQTEFLPEHQFFWFTPPVADHQDPCAAMRQHRGVTNTP